MNPNISNIESVKYVKILGLKDIIKNHKICQPCQIKMVNYKSSDVGAENT